VIVVFGVIIDRIYHTDRLINARAVDVFAQEEVIVVVFSDNVTAVIDVFEAVIIIDRLFDAPAGNTLPV